MPTTIKGQLLRLCVPLFLCPVRNLPYQGGSDYQRSSSVSSGSSLRVQLSGAGRLGVWLAHGPSALLDPLLRRRSSSRSVAYALLAASWCVSTPVLVLSVVDPSICPPTCLSLRVWCWLDPGPKWLVGEPRTCCLV